MIWKLKTYQDWFKNIKPPLLESVFDDTVKVIQLIKVFNKESAVQNTFLHCSFTECYKIMYKI